MAHSVQVPRYQNRRGLEDQREQHFAQATGAYQLRKFSKSEIVQ